MQMRLPKYIVMILPTIVQMSNMMRMQIVLTHSIAMTSILQISIMMQMHIMMKMSIRMTLPHHDEIVNMMKMCIMLQM